MKILQLITSSELGGAQSVVINIANTLCKEHEVIVAAGEGDGKIWDMLSDKVTCCKCRHLYKAVSLRHDLLALKELWSLYRKYRPDIIHLHSSKAGMLGRIVFPKRKTVYTVHGFDSIRIAHRKFLPLEKLMQNRCRAIVGVSEYDYQNLRSEGITDNVGYVYNGIYIPDSKELIKPDIFHKYEKTVLSIARVSAPKRHDLFIEVSRKFPQYGFIWIGNQEPIAGLPENCHFLGNIPNAGRYCRFTDLFCLISDYEGLPMSIIEAMSCGCPVIASDVGGIKEMVIDRENGFVLPNDADAFAEKIGLVLSDDAMLKSMGIRSKEIYEKNFTVDQMVKGYLDIYNS